MSHLNILILAFYTNLWHIKSDLSGNTIWPQKCKISSLRSQCWMRLFPWFSDFSDFESMETKIHWNSLLNWLFESCRHLLSSIIVEKRGGAAIYTDFNNGGLLEWIMRRRRTAEENHNWLSFFASFLVFWCGFDCKMSHFK